MQRIKNTCVIAFTMQDKRTMKTGMPIEIQTTTRIGRVGNTKNLSKTMSFIVQGLKSDGWIDKDDKKKISSISVHSKKSWIFS